MTEERAHRIRKLVELGMRSLSDKEASIEPALSESMKYTGELIEYGTRINWRGKLKRASVAVWDREEYNPDNAPDLWEDVAYREGYRIIPETITAGLAFDLDEYGWWGDSLYRSTIAANTYTPEQYAEGWELVKEE